MCKKQPTQAQVLATEATEQSKRVRITAGAAALGGAACFMLPVVGGVTLACLGAAAAAAATTRADEAGEAARASGRAVAAGFEKMTKMDLAGDARQMYVNAKKRLGPEPPPEAPESTSWWPWAPRVSRIEVYGKAKTPSDAASGILDEILAAPTADKRKRIATDIARELDDRALDTVSARATAAALSKIALLIRDYFEKVGWDDPKPKDAVMADLRPRLGALK